MSTFTASGMTPIEVGDRVQVIDTAHCQYFFEGIVTALVGLTVRVEFHKNDVMPFLPHQLRVILS